MKNTRPLFFSLALGSILFVSSCSNQIYSYREKVKVEPKTAQAKASESPKITKPATTAKSEAVAEKKIQSVAPDETKNIAKTETVESKQVLKDIQQMVPQQSSKAAGSKTFTAVKEQVKTLKKDIQKTQAGFHVDGMKWMIIGAVLCIAAWLLSVVGLGGGVVAAVGSIGGLIFLIGFIFWLIDVLK